MKDESSKSIQDTVREGQGSGLSGYGGVDRRTSQRIGEFAADSLNTAESFEDKLGINQVTTPQSFGAQEEPRGLKMPDMSVLNEAIMRRAMRPAQTEQAMLKREIKDKALQMKFDKMLNAQKMLQAEHQQNERARMNRRAHQINKRRARAATLGAVLGLGGMAAGAAVGGPAGSAAAGAMIGGSLGRGLGGMSGGGI